jgi:gamma-glutamyltranspeptidase/glutathione hydrolase
VTGKAGIVVSEHRQATQAGITILEQGGNAVDAAVAVGFALAVVDPCCGNLGGGGFMLIRKPSGQATVLDFRETAPEAATETMYQRSDGTVELNKSRKGYLAVGVPGTVKGLTEALRQYGQQSRSQVMSPAIQLAKSGFILEQSDITKLRNSQSEWQTDTEAKHIFLNHGNSYQVGERLVQKDLANTLQQIAQSGDAAFYNSAVTNSIVQASQSQGGILRLKDFAHYQVVERNPLVCSYRNYRVITVPLPGGGVTLCQIMAILNHESLQTSSPYQPERIHALASAFLFAFHDRNRLLGDPAFTPDLTKNLLSSQRIDEINAQRQTQQAIAPERIHFVQDAPDGTHTTHFSIMDRSGMIVSVTTTINSQFGAKVIAPGTGFFLNNEMDDFAAKPGTSNQFGLTQERPNRIEPGKRPLSSMSPTIILNQNQPWIVTGSPGGSTIPTTLFQIISRLIDDQMSPSAAISAPRIHYQGSPNLLLSEPFSLSDTTIQQLWEWQYRVVPFIPWGAAETIVIEPETQHRIGVNDPRRSGGAAMVQPE